jgi:2-methylisocitrate lyase-like PEP mutase family enzyme
MSKAATLRALLARDSITTLPGCWDALSARMIERAGFPAAFMSGYAVSAARIGLPDAGLISYAEMLSAGRDICAATAIPIVGDADTGFGNPANVRRAVQGYAQAGFACVMIEDQVFPKRCGYAQGLAVAPRDEVRQRLQAALDMRDEIRAAGGDLLVIGRTDARPAEGLEEALWRAEAFADMGADIVYFEGPQSEAEMAELNRRVATPTMLAQIEKPGRPWLNAAQAAALGYKLLLLGVTLLNATIRAQQDALAEMASQGRAERLVSFDTLYETVGFEDYYAIERRYLA